MCRVLGYTGTPVRLDYFLYEPDNSLLRQAYAPQMLHMLNLAGFGMTAWDSDSQESSTPFSYHSTQLPIFDRNLKALSEKVSAVAVLAHVRGVAYSHQAVVSEQNVHPFCMRGTPIAMAHNGDLAHFSEMKFDLLEHIKPDIARAIAGTTDSEWMYGLLLSQLEDPGRQPEPLELVRALNEVLRILRQVRNKVGISQSSSVNLFVCDGRNLVATRFTFDFGCWEVAPHEANLRYLSLWYTTGKNYGYHDEEWKMIGGAGHADSMLLASEPLTRDISTWVEVPEYSIMYATGHSGYGFVQTVEVDV
jgi:predicted glutamine amidotransferase